MSTLLSSISNTKIKVRWEEPYVSEALNKVAGAMDSGIQSGFIPTPAGGLSLSLGVDPLLGTSALLSRNVTSGYNSLYLETSSVSIDLTAHASTTVFIGASIAYAVSAVTTGEIRAYTQAEWNAGLAHGIVVICSVAVPAGVITQAMISTGPTSYHWKERLIAGSRAPVNAATPPQVKNTILYSYGTGPVTSGVTQVYKDYVVDGTAKDPKVVEMTHNTGTGVSYVHYGDLSVIVGETVWIRYRIRTAAFTGSFGPKIVWLNAAMGVVSTTYLQGSVVTTDTRAFEYAEATANAPVGAYACQVWLGVESCTAGVAKFDDVFITAPAMGRSEDASAVAKTFTAAKFTGITTPAGEGSINFSSTGFRLQGTGYRTEVFGNTGVRIESINSSNVHLESATTLTATATTTATVNGTTGVVLNATATGADVDLNATGTGGEVNIQGGYGSTGVSVEQAGNLKVNGNLILDGTMDRAVLTTPLAPTAYKRFWGNQEHDGLVYASGSAVYIVIPSTTTHAYSGKVVPTQGGWRPNADTESIAFVVPVACRTIEDIYLQIDTGGAADYVTYEVVLYTLNAKVTALPGSTDDGMKYLFTLAFNTQSTVGAVTPGFMKSLSSVGTWADFTALGPLYISIKTTLVGGASMASDAKIYGIKVKYTVDDLSEGGATIG